MLQKSKLLLLLAVLAWPLVLASPARADSHELELTSEITLSADGTTVISHRLEVANAAAAGLPENLEFRSVGRNLAGLKASVAGSGVSASDVPEERLIRVPLTAERRASGGSWVLTLSYESQGLNELGAISLVAVPRLAANFTPTSEQVKVVADLDFGFASVVGPDPTSTSVGIGQQIIEYASPDGPFNRSFVVQFGEQTYADINLTTKLENKGWWWRNVYVTLPPDTNQQRTRLESIEPTPNNVRLDKDGNMLVEYRLGPRQSIDVTARLRASITAQRYDFSSELGVEAIDQLLKDRYTAATPAWQPLGLDIGEPGESAKAIVAAVFSSVVEHARSSENRSLNQLELGSRSGSLEISDWLVGELRNRGVPARVTLGLLLSDGDHLSENPNRHAWVEAYVAGTGWVTLDPWLALFSDAYGSGDPLRVALGLWGIEHDRPPVLLEASSVSYSDEPLAELPEVPTVRLSATTYVWLPFVSVLTARAELPAGAIVDGAVMNAGANQTALGSLAPLQTVSQRYGRIGSTAFSQEAVSIGAIDDGTFTAWTETTSNVSYLPLIIIFSSAGVIALTVWWWRGRRTARRGQRRSKEALMLHDEATGGDIESENLIGTRQPLSPPESQTPSNNSGTIPPSSPPPPRPPRLVQ